eukprot:1160540-Pelagomonas_calceolata.AAC.7
MLARSCCHVSAAQEGGLSSVSSAQEGGLCSVLAAQEGGHCSVSAAQEGGHCIVSAAQEGGHCSVSAAQEGGPCRVSAAQEGGHCSMSAAQEGGLCSKSAATKQRGGDGESLYELCDTFTVAAAAEAMEANVLINVLLLKLILTMMHNIRPKLPVLGKIVGAMSNWTSGPMVAIHNKLNPLAESYTRAWTLCPGLYLMDKAHTWCDGTYLRFERGLQPWHGGGGWGH